ncbi:MAG TPA: rhodanese-like domain-containing protein [Rhodoblastus sp.]|nr:rhodanese-like domain-containing protein [Rhodoblastus sp.]
MIVVEELNLDEVKQGLADGSIALVDVREDEEWVDGHIPGATHNPLSRLDLDALPRDKRVVFYCRSGRRTLQALERAQTQGRPDVKAHFGGSWLAWTAAGEPVKTP